MHSFCLCYIPSVVIRVFVFCLEVRVNMLSPPFFVCVGVRVKFDSDDLLNGLR